MNDIFFFCDILITQACFASLVSQDYVNGTDQEEIRTGKNSVIADFTFGMFQSCCILRELFQE